MINLRADRTQSHYSRCYALSAFLNIMAPDTSIKFCFISLRHFIGHHTIQSKGQRHFMRSFGKFCSLMNNKIEKVPRSIRGKKSSKDMVSSSNLVSTIGAHASPTMGEGPRCPEGRALPAGMPHPLQMFDGNLSIR